MSGNTYRSFGLSGKMAVSVIRSLVLISVASLGLAVFWFASEAAAQLGVRINPAPLTGAVNQSLNVVNNQVSRGLTQMSTSVSRGLGQVNTSVNRGLIAINSQVYYPPIQVRYPSYRTSYRPTSLANRASSPARSSYYTPNSMTPPQVQRSKPVRLSDEQMAALRQHQAALAESQAGLGILSADSLARLSDKQAGLQNAARAAAFNAQIGEIIEWTYEGASGSVQAIPENRFGTMHCRTFEQSLTIDGETQTALASACQRGSGQ